MPPSSARQSQPFVNGFQGQPVITHQNHVIDDHQHQGKANATIGNLLYAFTNLCDAVCFKLVVKQVDRQQKNGGDQKRAQITQIFFHGMPRAVLTRRSAILTFVSAYTPRAARASPGSERLFASVAEKRFRA
ncbi:hypothetical protein [uncultured Desulfovibrio sp.]|uniref:hypothetical protein n=1 Tax=uncultured Desulfovibrio sp. TaxID=167968 RepID=UPI00272B8C17|nr:hypothetical protein [uncultured Desulfovibrio sp.]